MGNAGGIDRTNRLREKRSRGENGRKPAQREIVQDPADGSGADGDSGPRDRKGEFDPQTAAKHQRERRGFDDKILSMYSLGISTQGIQENLKDIYNAEVSLELISRVTDGVKGLVEEWRNRPPGPFCPVIFPGALWVNIRDEGRITKKAVYAATKLPMALAVRLDGQKELGETEFRTGCG